MVYHLKTKNRFINIIIIGLILLLPIIIFIFDIKIDCIFKRYLSIECPACGLTRAYYELFHFNLIKSLEYNLLAIPIAIFAILSVTFLIIDAVKNKHTYLKKLMNFFSKHYLIIILILVLNMFINNIK